MPLHCCFFLVQLAASSPACQSSEALPLISFSRFPCLEAGCKSEELSSVCSSFLYVTRCLGLSLPFVGYASGDVKMFPPDLDFHPCMFFGFINQNQLAKKKFLATHLLSSSFFLNS